MVPQRHDHSRIGLLGGSFNPAHDGHREISVAALDVLGLDAIWWLVSPGNPLKDAGAYAPYEERMQTARRVAQHPAIVVSNFEQRKGLQYTVDTVGTLTALWPDIHFVWLMGADGLAGFDEWKDWREIFAAIPIAVFNRPGYAEAALESVAAREFAAFRRNRCEADELAQTAPPAWVFIEHTANPISSTAIRSGFQEP